MNKNTDTQAILTIHGGVLDLEGNSTIGPAISLISSNNGEPENVLALIDSIIDSGVIDENDADHVIPAFLPHGYAYREGWCWGAVDSAYLPTFMGFSDGPTWVYNILPTHTEHVWNVTVARNTEPPFFLPSEFRFVDAWESVEFNLGSLFEAHGVYTE